MAKFLKRILNRHSKGKDLTYIRYVLEIPARVNGKIAAYLGQILEIDVTSTETQTQEVLSISITRKKQQTNLAPAK